MKKYLIPIALLISLQLCGSENQRACDRTLRKIVNEFQGNCIISVAPALPGTEPILVIHRRIEQNEAFIKKLVVLVTCKKKSKL